MVDVNRAWDFRTACEGVKLLEAFRPRWLEEPVAWEEPVMGKKHRAWGTSNRQRYGSRYSFLA